MGDMVAKKSWSDFRDTGLLALVNLFLHIFGWSLVYEFDEEDIHDETGEVRENAEPVVVYPARVKFRGMHEPSQDRAYRKISQFMKENAETLLEEATMED